MEDVGDQQKNAHSCTEVLQAKGNTRSKSCNEAGARQARQMVRVVGTGRRKGQTPGRVSWTITMSKTGHHWRVVKAEEWKSCSSG